MGIVYLLITVLVCAIFVRTPYSLRNYFLLDCGGNPCF